MFTGLVETTGIITEVRTGENSLVLGVRPAMNGFTVNPGASVAVDGACLTVETAGGDTVYLRAVAETLRCTNLGGIRPGNRVNLERSLRVSDRFDGHIVLGHVDGVGMIAGDTREGDSIVRAVRVPGPLLVYMAQKGSVALDGISLTIAAMAGETLTVSFIPHTLAHTTMGGKKPGMTVNVEVDVLARYIRRMAAFGNDGTRESAPATRNVAVSSSHPETLIDKIERMGF